MKKIKILAALLSVAMVFSVSSLASGGRQIYRGSIVDENEAPGVNDALEILKKIVGLPSLLDDPAVAMITLGDGGSAPPVSTKDDDFYRGESSTTASRAGAVEITLTGSGATSSDEDKARWQAASTDPTNMRHARVQIREGGTYVIKGDLNNAYIHVNSRDETGRDHPVTLILDGVNITNNNGPAIYGRRASVLNIVIADGSRNTLTDSVNYDSHRDEDPDATEPNATIFTHCDLNIWGKGELTVRGNHRHGIHTRDELVIRGGKFNITAGRSVGGELVGNGIIGRDNLTIRNGDFNITTENHGLRASNIMTARPNDTGIVRIEEGRFVMNTKGDGIRAENLERITGGDFTTNSRIGRGGSDD
jgi:hypothetical protein